MGNDEGKFSDKLERILDRKPADSEGCEKGFMPHRRHPWEKDFPRWPDINWEDFLKKSNQPRTYVYQGSSEQVNWDAIYILKQDEQLSKESGWLTYHGENLLISIIRGDRRAAFIAEITRKPADADAHKETLDKYFPNAVYSLIGERAIKVEKQDKP